MTRVETTTAPRSVPVPAKKLPIPLLRQAFQILTFLLLVTVSYLLISNFLLETVKLVGRSMRPTCMTPSAAC